MATRSRTSFQKRQRELLRMEKQSEKAARRAQRKIEGQAPGEPVAWPADASETAPDQNAPHSPSPAPG